jgi:superfamily II DNA or RNA helicase
VITSEDQRMLARLVDGGTFTRGLEYARTGRVRTHVWSQGGTMVVGEVRGSGRNNYQVTVVVGRSPSGALTSFDSECTCPVIFECKHGVAVVLADRSSVGPGAQLTLVRDAEEDTVDQWSGTVANPAARPPAGAGAAWELPLRALMDGPVEDAEDEGQATFGLQFELGVTGRSDGMPTMSIRIRPVAPGAKGNWVKSGVSWSSLEYRTRGPRRRLNEQLEVVKELRAISHLADPYGYYRYGEDVVCLEKINSRRVWDLLGHARDLGVALVQPARQGGPVTLHTEPAQVALDVTRVDTGLSVRPLVTADGTEVPLATSLVVGSPAHGIAWWNDPAEGAGGGTLDLVPFATPVDDGLGTLLETAAFGIPRRDEDRFVHTMLPRLRKRVAVVSSDPTVDLPEPKPPMLHCTVRYEDGHRIAVSWARGTVGSEWTEPLWDRRNQLPDRPVEDALVAAATAVVEGTPQLFEPTAIGPRLAGRAELVGMTAARFASVLVPVLRELPGIELVEVGVAPDYHEAAEAPVVSLGGGGSSESGDWFDLSVSVTIEGEEVPFADLFVALAEGQPYLILPSGTYFALDRPELVELAQLIAEARALLDSSGDTLRLSRFQAGLWEDLKRLGVITAQAGAWEESVRALSEASDRTEYEVPTHLHAALRPYQLTGFNWLAYLYEHRLGGILADDMGLGKTLEALALMCHTWERGLTEAPYLVVAPTSVVGNWAAECTRFAPDLQVVPITQTAKRREESLAELADGADVVVTSYSLFRLGYEEYAGVEWAGLFLDEAQFAKNRQSQAYQKARLLPVPFKVAMTGTPIENNLMELWSLLSITAPGLFPDPEGFTEYYRHPVERHGDVERLDQLRRRVRPLMLRRTKEQVASDLPDKQEQVLELELNPRHWKVYQTHLQRERQKVLGLLGDLQKHRFEIFRSLTLLRQASLDASLIDEQYAGVPSTKLDALMEMLDDIVADGHRVLVFSQFTRFLTLARQRLEAAGIELCYLDGKTRQRTQVIDSFRSGSAPVFLISLKAGGFGLNLTEADYCILLDPWWNPATEAQAVDRVHRIGQTRKVMVYRLVAKDTIEEKVMALKEKKSALFANVMDAGGLESGALTASDIRSLLD